jgi:hypothetical protein
MYNNVLYNNLSLESPKIIQNDDIKILFKEHQKTAIYAMIKFEETGKVSFTKKAYLQNYQIRDEEMYNYRHNEDFQKKSKDMLFEIETNYGILADKVGSGKTFITMGLICYNQVPIERDRIINSSIFTVTKYRDIDKPFKTNLILVPHNLTHQWKQAFGYSNLKTFTIIKKSDIDFLEFEDNIFKNDYIADDADYNETNCVEYYDVIIVSATMFTEFYNRFNEIKWARIIIDEVVSIKLPSELEFKCNFIWFLTATPSGIKCVRRHYIRSLVYSMSEDTVKNIIIKNNDDYVDNSMNLPNLKQIIIKCLTPKEFRLIKEYVDEDIINMLNGGDIQGAIIKLNCNISTSDNILEVITKKIKKELHNKRTELKYENERIHDDQKIHEEKIKKIENKIKELESKCAGIEERIKSFKQENCPICYDEFNSPMLIRCCNNLVCIQCLTMCNSICPLCRSNFKINECTLIDDINDNKKKDINKDLCSKIDNLITILNKNPNGKFLLFSDYEKTFENINQKLTDNNIKHSRLVGSNIVINSTIKKFELGEIKVLMLNVTNYGSGLNLQMATDIIIYHELDLEKETQVIGRAQRLGRKEPLNVYYLLNDCEKVNCKNPTLNLDIFANDQSMLDNYIQSNTKIEDIVNNDSEDIIIKVKKTRGKKK